MLSDEAFQKLLFDLFCVWHDVQRHYDPPITHTEDEKMAKVKQMICKLLGEIDGRVKKIKSLSETEEQEFIEEWTMLTWNVLCITSRLQNSLPVSVKSSEDKVIFSKLNLALVELVNHSRSAKKPPTVDICDATFDLFANRLAETMYILHNLYRTLKSAPQMTPDETEAFAQRLQEYADQHLIPFVDIFKSFCNEQSVRLWQQVRQAQTKRMIDYGPMPHDPVNQLVSFYSHMMHRLAILGARLQGFRYELTINKVFGDYDPVQPLSDNVFSALELLMADCVLATEPSTNPILVTNNLFSINCGALARGVVFKKFDIQVITEEAAEHIQSEMRRQKMLQQPSPIGNIPSAALLAMKPTSGTKRTNQGAEGQGNTAHKKADVNSKDIVTIYPVFNSKNRYWAASYPHLLCTTRQKGRHSTNNSFQDLSPGGALDLKSNGKRPIFYFHIRATMFSPSGKFADAHTLSLPLTIATRRNQDCQVQRMMSSYTATCFWLYGNNFQDGLLLQWTETGMSWEKFKYLFMQHFRVNAEVQRGLQDSDFDLLQYKIQCNDCTTAGSNIPGDVGERTITFKNMLCPHLRYECGSTNVRFSVWRGMLELLQIFQDPKTNVRKLWEKNLIMGFLEFDQVSSILANHQSALIMRLSFVTGGTICFTVKSNVHALQQGATAPMHLEPLDLKKLQAKCLKDYLRDIAVAEKVKYIINSNYETILISDILPDLFNDAAGGSMEDLETSRHISSNVTHSGDIDAMQMISFTAMRIAVVTCKVKPPSADIPADEVELINGSSGGDHPDGIKVSSPVGHPSHGSGYPSGNSVNPFIPHTNYRLPSQASQDDDFVREVVQLCNFHGKSKQELVELLTQAPENIFASLSLSSRGSQNLANSALSSQPVQNGFGGFGGQLNGTQQAGSFYHQTQQQYSPSAPPNSINSLLNQHQYYDGMMHSNPESSTMSMTGSPAIHSPKSVLSGLQQPGSVGGVQERYTSDMEQLDSNDAQMFFADIQNRIDGSPFL
ncbi:signal transducer and activator of transcription 1 [Ditylenchus destructor]|uniref:Signal transducer and activator of transcription 1 n=1 Tax=Ditylenchus destructor TaxID=166010 RepID=A0AAD4R6Y3_9BILA|nr:signal transducer and activator of transcription 1 [Ditylenchus destructor]